MSESTEQRIERYLERAEELLEQALFEPDPSRMDKTTAIADIYAGMASVAGEHLRV